MASSGLQLAVFASPSKQLVKTATCSWSASALVLSQQLKKTSLVFSSQGSNLHTNCPPSCLICVEQLCKAFERGVLARCICIHKAHFFEVLEHLHPPVQLLSRFFPVISTYVPMKNCLSFMCYLCMFGRNSHPSMVITTFGHF